jgi:hypothetical protein
MVSRDGLKALTNGNMKIHKVLALPPSLEEDSIYFVKNGTGADLYIVSNEGTATKVSSGVDYGLTLGEEGDTAYRGDRGKFAYDHAQSPHVETKTDIGLGHVNNTSDLDKPISDDTQAALDTKAEPLTVSDSAPMSPDEGDLWFNSDIGQLYTYYTDGDSGQWVSASGGGVPVSTSKTGWMDYNDASGSFSISANTWTDIPNDGAGAFTNKGYRPQSVSEVLDASTGYLDFTDLPLGSEIALRNDVTVTPNTNNALLEMRYVLGGGANEYALNFLAERLDSGSGIAYQRVTTFPIYMGDINTKSNPGKLQIRLSTPGTVQNAGVYASIQLF